MIKLFRYLKPYSFIVVVLVVFLFAQAMAELYLPTLMSDVVNKGMMQGDNAYIINTGSKMLVVALGSSICAILSSLFAAKVGIAMGRDIRNSVFEKAEGYSLREFDKIGTASLITRTTNDIVQIQSVVVMGFRFILYSPIMCIGGFIMAYSRDKHLTTVLAVAVPALVLTMGVLAALVVPSFKKMQSKIDKLNLTVRESLTGIRVIRAFGRMNHEKKRFFEANLDLMETSVYVNKTMAIMQPVMMLIMNATIIAIIWFGGNRVNLNLMQIGDMMAFMQYAMQIIFSLIMVAVMFIMVPRAQVSAGRVNEVLELHSDIKESDNPEKNTDIKQNVPCVEFKNVSFTYLGAQNKVLKNVSFESNIGETTAIIGGTGSGKTTLINLIPRFYDADEGEILVNGTNIKNMDKDDLKGKIGFVPQSAILFSGTIKENIKFGKKDATEEELLHAAKVAQAYDFISEMPDKFESHIAQGGTNVSGGQKQRLSIARAIVRKPEIYIFDDSFSALDFKTDAKLREALKNETKGATVILIAQRIATVMDADKIIVLENGEIVGTGKHKELLKSCEVYKEIVSSQFSEGEIA